jgi:hypothetical protein
MCRRTAPRRTLCIAKTATIGGVICADGKEIVLSGDGLDTCALASAQQVGPFGLSAGTLVHLAKDASTSSKCPRPPSHSRSLASKFHPAPLSLYATRYRVAVGARERLRDDCGHQAFRPDGFRLRHFEYGTLFEATVLETRQLPRGAAISSDDLPSPSPAEPTRAPKTTLPEIMDSALLAYYRRTRGMQKPSIGPHAGRCASVMGIWDPSGFTEAG